jgi:hypothetical protein
LFSDVHAPLQILLSVNLNNNDSNSNTVRKTNHSKAKIKSWENEKVTDFQENIDEEKLHTFEQKITKLIFRFIHTNSVECHFYKIQICKIVNKVSNIIINMSVFDQSTKSVSVAVLALKKNKFDNLLLNFCKGNSMFTVNGRVGNNTNIGRFTCRNASVVDYCITSPDF